MNYIEAANEAGYSSEDYSVAVLEEIGTAIERALCDWDWYEAGKVESSHYQAVVDYFDGSDEEPNMESLVAAYAEGMACDH